MGGSLPTILVLRPLAQADIPALAALHAAAEVADDLGEHVGPVELEEDLARPQTTVLGAFDGDTLVGAVHVHVTAGAPQAVCIGITHPDRRDEGIGTALVSAMLEHAGEATTVIAVGRTTNTSQAELLAASGFVAARWSFLMRADLSAAEDPGDPPAGYRVRACDPSADTEPWRLAHNAAFRDHPNSTPWTPEAWRSELASAAFRPDVSFLLSAEDEPDAVVSYVGTEEHAARRQATGLREACIARVGTVREHRGRGLAGWLLRHSLAAYRAAGYDSAVLSVDSENPTGALRLYERAGFIAERQFTVYVMFQGARPPGTPLGT